MSELESVCVHHWLIESPDGPTVKGYCKKCGVARTYASGEHFTKDSAGRGVTQQRRLRGAAVRHRKDE